MAKTSRKQDVPLSEPVRNYGPRNIAALIAPVVRPAFRKRAPAAVQLLTDWQALAGQEFSALAQPVKFSAGTLTLACSGPAAMEIAHRSMALMSRLNLGLGKTLVESLRFVQAGAPHRAVPAPPRPAVPAEPPAGLPPGDLGAALVKLYQALKSRAE